MARKLTHQEFMDRVEGLVGEEYKVIGEYEGSDTKLIMRHNKCGNEYPVTPYKFSSGRRCPKCSGNQRKTHQQFTEEFNEASKGEYSLKSKYVRAKSKVKVSHNKCGWNYEVTPDAFLRGRRCPNCAEMAFRESRKKTPKQFKEQFDHLARNEYELLSEYRGDSEKIKVKHLSCGKIYAVTASSFIQGRRCRKCQMKRVRASQTWTQKDFERKVQKLGFGEYVVTGKYTLSVNKVEMKHLTCCHVYDVTAADFVQGARCPRCQSSRGEIKVGLYLKENGYDFIPQYRIDDCRNKRPLPFDFAVLEDNEIMCLIEYHGRQHYAPVVVFGGEKEFELTQQRDAIKRNYCIKNEIPLIEIPYTTKDIKSFLDENIKKLG